MKILVTGMNSYVGCSFENYIKTKCPSWEIVKISLRDGGWKNMDFSGFDSVFHVAGIAHADTGGVTPERQKEYYAVNCDLTAEVAKKAAADGVTQFIYMSSIIVYSGFKGGIITKTTPLGAENFYGDSKIKAEEKLENLKKDGSLKGMKIVTLRPPMIYGKNSKGNFPTLVKLANKAPFFPATRNRRSMLYIENLCEFVRLVMENEAEGLYFPQNGEYSDTAELVRMIAACAGKKLPILEGFFWTVAFSKAFPGKAGRLAKKAFGDLAYDMSLSEYEGGNYRVCTLSESVERTCK